MRLRPDVLLFAGLLIFMSGCAGNQWNERLVEGSNGPVTEIRIGARSSAPGRAIEVGGVADPQARRMELQDRLLKMAAMMPVQHYTDYRVGSEDALQITFLGSGSASVITPVSALGGSAGQPSSAPSQLNNVSGQLSGLFRVDGQGKIRLMLVGNVTVAGLTPIEIAEKLTRLYKDEGYLVDPQITVSVAEYRHSEVAVSGAVSKPAYYPLIGPRSLLDVLGMAGGLAVGAGDTVNIIRPRHGVANVAGQGGLNAQTIVIDLNQLLLQGDTSLNIPIDNGDVVFVPFAQSAYVIGAVTKPGNVLLQDNMTLTKAISLCQGKDIRLASNYVTVLRVAKNGKREVIPVNLGQVLDGREADVMLKPNDIVYVHDSKIRRFLFDLKMFLPGSFGLSATSSGL